MQVQPGLTDVDNRPQISLDNALRVDGVHPATSGVILCGQRREIACGEVLRFDLMVGGLRTWELVRAPEGSKASFIGAQLAQTEAPGVYVVRCVLSGGFSREVDIVAFPDKALDLLGPKSMIGGDRRLVARGIINDPRATRATIAAALEDEQLPERHPHHPPVSLTYGFDGAIIGVTRGFSVQSYGGVQATGGAR